MDVQGMSAADRQALMAELQDAERADQQRTFDRHLAALLAMFDGDEYKAIDFTAKALATLKRDREKQSEKAMLYAMRGIG
jgi:hypothetical protein